MMMMAVTQIFLKILQQNNRVEIENEIRTEANNIMEQLGRDIRSAACGIVNPAQTELTLFTDQNCLSSQGQVTYSWSSEEPYSLRRNGIRINSQKVSLRNCNACSQINCSAGFLVAKINSKVFNIKLFLQQARSPRQDFCGKISLEKTFKCRN